MTEPVEYSDDEAPIEDFLEQRRAIVVAEEPADPADVPLDADPADYADQLREAGPDEEDHEHG